MKERPKSKFEDEFGGIDISAYNEAEEYPRVLAWDKKYADECDRLSAERALLTGKRHWGRWVLNLTRPRSLDCIEVCPAIGRTRQRELYPYEIVLSRIGKDGESDGNKHYTWQEHMAEKNWMGKQGLADFVLAVSEIAKEHPEWLHK